MVVQADLRSNRIIEPSSLRIHSPLGNDVYVMDSRPWGIFPGRADMQEVETSARPEGLSGASDPTGRLHTGGESDRRPAREL